MRRLSYRRAAELLVARTGWTLHQFRHSALTHLAEDNVQLPLRMAKSRHRSRARPVSGQRSPAAGARAGLGRKFDRNAGPARRPAISRDNSRALPEPKNSQSTSPPLGE